MYGQHVSSTRRRRSRRKHSPVELKTNRHYQSTSYTSYTNYRILLKDALLVNSALHNQLSNPKAAMQFINLFLSSQLRRSFTIFGLGASEMHGFNHDLNATSSNESRKSFFTLRLAVCRRRRHDSASIVLLLLDYCSLPAMPWTS